MTPIQNRIPFGTLKQAMADAGSHQVLIEGDTPVQFWVSARTIVREYQR